MPHATKEVHSRRENRLPSSERSSIRTCLKCKEFDNMSATNYFTLDGEILAEEAIGGSPRCYATDMLSSVINTFSASGSLENSYKFSPFGDIATKTGAASDPAYMWIGGFGYRATNRDHCSHYIRARHLSSSESRWTSVDPLWPDQQAYTYVGCAPTSFADPPGTKQMTCAQLRKCLKATPWCECNHNNNPVDIDIMLCMAWQESNMGALEHRSGILSLTQIAFDDLVQRGCAWLKAYGTYKNFIKSATDCQKAQASYNYATLVGWRRFGPGRGKPGDYRGPLGDKILCCADCLKTLNLPGATDQQRCMQCLSLVHS